MKKLNSVHQKIVSYLERYSLVKEIDDDNTNDECVYVSDDDSNDSSDDCIEVESHMANSDVVEPISTQSNQSSPVIARKPRSYRLVSFCSTRWYSAWLVMSRFYSLRRSLRALADELNEKRISCTSKNRDKFINAIGLIKDVQVQRVIHFLYPLVQGIDYCQRNNSMQVDIDPMMDSLYEFYMNHGIPNSNNQYDLIIQINQKLIDSAFGRRLSLFNRMPSKLRSIYYDELYQGTSTLLLSSDVLQNWIHEACGEIREYVGKRNCFTNDFKERVDTADLPMELFKYVRDKKNRYSVHNAMELWCDQYPILFELYKHFFNAPASSAAVERSFSIQNAIVIPRRSQLNPTLIKQLLFINMNVKSANAYGWREEMMKYLNTNANKQQQ